MIKIFLQVVLFLLLSFSVNDADAKAILIDNFENGLKPQWRSKKVGKRQTQYRIIRIDDNHVLQARSVAAASALVYEYRYDLKEHPILTWKWKVENIIKTGNVRKREGNDCAARVYVVFEAWLLPLTRVVSYIWANKLPKGEYIPSPHYARAMLVAIQSGDENVGKWITERRNVYEDFKILFGREPPHVRGIAIMTDTENTGESATAYYDDIMIEKLE
jgi:hypothetical protein